MAETATTVQEIRSRIDDIDNQLLALMSQRAELALEMGRVKREVQSYDYYCPEREAQILHRIIEQNKGPLDDATVINIFRALISACLAMQQKMQVAFLGPVGTFSQAAALQHFTREADFLVASSIEEIFKLVETGEVPWGVVPIENSHIGVVRQTLNALASSTVQICGETIVSIDQNLLRKKGAVGLVKKIYSHELSFSQCGKWLKTNYADVQKIAVGSNGEAAKLASQEEDAAAIAGKIAAMTYDLDIIVPHIEMQANNQTRFLIIGKQKVSPSGRDKTTLLITTPHTPGALIELMQPFAKEGVNITWIESRPYQHRNWSYLFFLDVDGHQEDEKVKAAIEKLSSKPILITVLGSYPKAIIAN